MRPANLSVLCHNYYKQADSHRNRRPLWLLFDWIKTHWVFLVIAKVSNDKGAPVDLRSLPLAIDNFYFALSFPAHLKLAAWFHPDVIILFAVSNFCNESISG